MFILVHETQMTEVLINLDNVEDIRERSDGTAQIELVSSAYVATTEAYEVLKGKIRTINQAFWDGRKNNEQCI